MVGTSPILLLLEPPAGQGPPANAHIPAFLAPPAPFQIESWRQAQAGAVWQCQWPSPQPSRPAIRDRISAGIVLHFLTAGPSPSLLFLSPFFASKYLLWPRSSSVECVEVWGSGWCAVQKADLEPVQLGGNQLYQDEFLCPEALAGQ